MTTTPEPIIGIDLGTTNSLVAVCDEKGPRVLRDAQGESCVPSFMAFDADGRVSIGFDAKQHAVENPESTIFSVKRMMGRGFDELQASGELNHLPYAVVKRTGSESVAGNSSPDERRDIAAVKIHDRLMTPPELSAIILRELKRRAESELGCDVVKAVITVPAYFDDAQRQATRDAGRIAGLEVVRVVNEPTAAALAYGLGVKGQLEKRSAPGAQAHGALPLAGSCSTSEAPESDASHSNDLRRTGSGNIEDATVAVYDLGGGTFDVSILRLVDGVFEVMSTHGNTSLGGDDLDREIIGLVLREIREQYGLDIDSPSTKQAIRSFAENVKVRLSTEQEAPIEIDLGSDRVYRRTLTRDEFEGMIAPWVKKTVESCKQALRNAKLKADAIDQVVLVGGSTRIPLVRQRVGEVFRRQPYTALNPDEVVALGAAVQASILAGMRRDTLLLDVIPLSLGIETMGGAMGKLILRNSRVPCHASEMFSTFVDGQSNVKINVLQGERELAKDCRSLGEFELRGIPPMPAGLPKIRVTFLVDENGILNVSAREERSDQEASIQIVPSHGLTSDEVNRMEREAYEFAREDMTAHRLIDLRNQVAFDTDKAEKMLARMGEELDPAQREAYETSIRALRSMAETSADAEALHKALNEFDHATVPLAEMAISRTLREDQ